MVHPTGPHNVTNSHPPGASPLCTGIFEKKLWAWLTRFLLNISITAQWRTLPKFGDLPHNIWGPSVPFKTCSSRRFLETAFKKKKFSKNSPKFSLNPRTLGLEICTKGPGPLNPKFFQGKRPSRLPGKKLESLTFPPNFLPSPV
jgi:hypothetical protein